MKKEIEICENCIHFIRHYIKRLMRFEKLDLGHCRKKRFKQIRIDDLCGEFIKKDEVAENERQALCIKHQLEKISKELLDIKQVLKNV